MEFLARFKWLIILLSVIWVIQFLNLITSYTLNSWFGLIPRTISGADGILFMPLLHGSLAHAAANSAPLAVLGSVLSITARSVAVTASAIIVVLGGMGVWIIGGTALHVGASGLIFGWFAFLVARGVIEKQAVPLLVAVAVALIYGTMLWGVLPGQPGISWESHLMGALAGVAAAALLRTRGRALE